jgi:N-acetyl-gamma-glutamyl-phosphate reductase
MKYKVFVDGKEGTTGLKLHERLALQPDIELLNIDDVLRKDTHERARLINEADVVFLCLPDAASIEAVSLVKNENTRVIDASTAFRCDDGWAYGFPELNPTQRQLIGKSKRVAVPGCYATGFTSAVYPLLQAGIISGNYPLTVSAVSGYTGAGKKLIEKYEQGRSTEPSVDIHLKSPRMYALGLNHKHLPEMIKINDLLQPPLFMPMVGDFDRGMLVSLPLCRQLLKKDMDASALHSFYSHYYEGEQFVKVMPQGGEGSLDGGFLDATGCNGTNRLELFVFGHDGQILVVTRLDNLGKGASGAAVQCMNIMLGQDEAAGLI